jgi:hypothetical protein
MFFYLISSDKGDTTTSSSINVVELLPISMTKISQEFGKENNRIIHLSTSIIFIFIDNNDIIKILNAFNFSVTELPFSGNERHFHTKPRRGEEKFNQESK